jgi:hypothetical protein
MSALPVRIVIGQSILALFEAAPMFALPLQDL